jgi:BASS family bile acid:Na+ symporter
MQPADILVIAIKASILLTVLAIGLNANWRDATYLFRRPSLLLRSLLAMNVLMPLVAALLAVTFNLPTAVKVALVALAISPVPPILPKKQMKAGGDESYAIGLLVAIAVLSIVIVPLSVTWFASMFDREAQISPVAIGKAVVGSILAPLAVGIVVHEWRPALAQRLARPVGLVGTILLFASALTLLYFAWPSIAALIGDGAVVLLAVMAACGLAIGHVLGGPDSHNRSVLALSTASRHPAVALAIGVAAGEESKRALAAVLLYVLVAVIVSVPYVLWRKRLARTREGDS